MTLGERGRLAFVQISPLGRFSPEAGFKTKPGSVVLAASGPLGLRVYSLRITSTGSTRYRRVART